MSEELPHAEATAAAVEITAETLIHPQAVDFLVHAVGLEVGFQLISQTEAVDLGERLFQAYWHIVNVRASYDAITAIKIDLDTPIAEVELKAGAVDMLRHQETCIIQARRYLAGEDMATLVHQYYPPAPGSSRIAAFRHLSQNIRTTASGIAQINKMQYKGGLLKAVIDRWRHEDPTTMPTIFSPDRTLSRPTPTLERYGGKLPRSGLEAQLGIVVIARSVTESPFPRETSREAAPPGTGGRKDPRSGSHSHMGVTAIPTAPTANASQAQILAARASRLAAMKKRSAGAQPPRQLRRRPRDDGETPPNH